MNEYYGTVYTNCSDLIEDFRENQFYLNSSFKFVCRFYDENDIEALFELCSIVENVCLVIEEFSIYFRDRKKFLGLEKLVSQGRHYGTSLILLSQRVPEISPSLRAQKTSIFTFQQDEPNDLRMLETFGFVEDDIRHLIPYDSSELTPTRNYHYQVIGEDLAEIQENSVQ